MKDGVQRMLTLFKYEVKDELDELDNSYNDTHNNPLLRYQK